MSQSVDVLSRRRFLRGAAGVATLAAAGGLLSACTTPPAQQAAPGASSAQSVKLQLWTFVNTHARWWRAMAEEFKKTTPGFHLDVSEMAQNEMHDKLQVAVSTGVGVPDIADINQNRYGAFLKGDAKLVELTPRLQAGGYSDQFVQSRLALYSLNGKTYGIEHALAPVVLYYRSDVFESAGLKPEHLATWDEFVRAGQQLSKGGAKMTFLHQNFHELLLRQRGGDYFDATGQVSADSDLSVKTENWLLDLRDVHGIADQSPSGPGTSLNSPANWSLFKEGKILAVTGADWYSGWMKDNVPDGKGKWRAMPLPAWEPGGVQTSCYGGTGASIPSASKNIEAAWKFLEFTVLSAEGNVRRFQETGLFPPLKTAWSDPRLKSPDAYFGGQDLSELFVKIGEKAPPQYQSPYRSEFNSLMLDKYTPDIFSKKLSPADGLKQVSDEIRKRIQEGA